MRKLCWLTVVLLCSMFLAAQLTAQLAPVRSSVTQEQTPVQYIMVDVSGSMNSPISKAAQIGKSFGPQPRRLLEVSKWVKDHAEVELDAGRKVVIVLFNSTIIRGTNSRFEIQPGPSAKASLDSAIKSLESASAYGGTRVWGSVGELIDRELRGAPANSGVSVFTDGEPDDDKSVAAADLVEEQRVTKELGDIWGLPDFEMKYRLQKYTWRSNWRSGVVLAPSATVNLDREVVFEASDLAGAGSTKSVAVKLIQSSKATAGDRLILDASRAASALTSVSSSQARGFRVQPKLVPDALDQRTTIGKLELTASGTYEGSEDLVYSFQPEFVYETKLAGVEPSEARQGVKASPIRVVVRGIKSALTGLETKPKLLTLNAQEAIAISLKATAATAGKKVTLTPELMKKNAEFEWQDAGDRQSAPDGRPLTFELPAGNPEIQITKTLLVRRKADQQQVNDTLKVSATLAGSTTGALTAETNLVYGAIRVVTELNGTLKPVDIAPENPTWQQLNAVLDIQVQDPGLIQGQDFNIEVVPANDGGDVEIAFDGQGSRKSEFNRLVTRGRDIQLYARWKKNAKNFGNPQVQAVQINLHPRDQNQDALKFVATNKTLLELNGLVAAVQPRVWAVVAGKEVEGLATLPERSLKLQSTDTTGFELRWNAAAKGMGITIKEDFNDQSVRFAARPEVTGNVRESGDRGWNLPEDSFSGIWRYTLNSGESAIDHARARWQVFVGTNSTAILDIRQPYAMQEGEASALKFEVTDTGEHLSGEMYQLGILKYRGTGKFGDLIVKGEMAGKALPAGFTLDMTSQHTAKANQQAAEVPVFVRVTGSESDEGEFSGRVIIDKAPEGGLSIKGPEKVDFKIKLKATAKWEQGLNTVKFEKDAPPAVRLGRLKMCEPVAAGVEITAEASTNGFEIGAGFTDKLEKGWAGPIDGAKDVYISIQPPTTLPPDGRFDGVLHVKRVESGVSQDYPFSLTCTSTSDSGFKQTLTDVILEGDQKLVKLGELTLGHDLSPGSWDVKVESDQPGKVEITGGVGDKGDTKWPLPSSGKQDVYVRIQPKGHYEEASGKITLSKKGEPPHTFSFRLKLTFPSMGVIFERAGAIVSAIGSESERINILSEPVIETASETLPGLYVLKNPNVGEKLYFSTGSGYRLKEGTFSEATSKGSLAELSSEQMAARTWGMRLEFLPVKDRPWFFPDEWVETVYVSDNPQARGESRKPGEEVKALSSVKVYLVVQPIFPIVYVVLALIAMFVVGAILAMRRRPKPKPMLATPVGEMSESDQLLSDRPAVRTRASAPAVPRAPGDAKVSGGSVPTSKPVAEQSEEDLLK